MTLSIFRSASLVDFGVTNELWSLYEEEYLQKEGWAAVRLTRTLRSVAITILEEVHAIMCVWARATRLHLPCRDR